MKKVLLSSSAVALVAIAAPANAAEWEVTVGGYAQAMVGFGSTDFDNDIDPDIDQDGVGFHRDFEGRIDAAITLDNGLQFGFQAELELEAEADTNVDESEVFIEGAFGEIVIGNEDAAGERMAIVAPDVGIIAANSGTMSNYIQYDEAFGYVFSLGKYSTIAELGSDATGITYFTPRLAGVQLGVTYMRTADDADEDLETDLNGEGIAHLTSFGVNYVNSFGGVDLAVAGHYQFAQAQQSGFEDPERYGAGINVGFGGFTVGGSWGETNDSAAYGAIDGRSFDIGVSYETGPWAASFTYMYGEDTVPAGAIAFNSPSYDQEISLFNVGGTYALAQGVTLVAEGGYATYENALGDADGFYIASGVNLSF